ncbi:MAG TPA: FliA/WhiG family RNA polymerase sigma factor [Terriglobia bacterium]|nr:FliA/WhiG family RNA polymerase sigma factor [Terriglobia bacterium]
MATQTVTAALGQSAPRSVNSRRRTSWSANQKRVAAKAQREALAVQRERQREELTVKLMGLVKRVAFEMREHLPAHLDLDDLVSAGTLGLIDAVRRFEADKHVKIETYARYRIKGAILDALRNLDPASRDMRKKNKRAERVFRELEMKLGRPATDAEMAEAMHMSLNSWYKMVHEMQAMGLEWLRPTDMAPARPLAEEDLPATDEVDQFELCYRREQRDLIARSLDRVSERERLVLSLYYVEDLTMKQIGDQLGVDESRVSQIHSVALSRLRSKVQSMMRPPLPSVRPPASSAVYAQRI